MSNRPTIFVPRAPTTNYYAVFTEPVNSDLATFIGSKGNVCSCTRPKLGMADKMSPEAVPDKRNWDALITKVQDTLEGQIVGFPQSTAVLRSH